MAAFALCASSGEFTALVSAEAICIDMALAGMPASCAALAKAAGKREPLGGKVEQAALINITMSSIRRGIVENTVSMNSGVKEFGGRESLSHDSEMV